MHVLHDFLICVPATVFFCILFRVPRRAVFYSALLGAAGYAVYDLTSPAFHSAVAGYFLGTLLMAVCSEILARIMKMPATIFMIPAIIPLVPGIGLYNTMQYLVQQRNDLAAGIGTTTLIEIVAMAMAMVLTGILTKTIMQIRGGIAHLRRKNS